MSYKECSKGTWGYVSYKDVLGVLCIYVVHGMFKGYEGTREYVS